VRQFRRDDAVTTRFEYRDVRVDGDDGPIICGFSAAIPSRGLTVIVGRSGVGKTTLLRLLNRLDDPDDGSVLYDGQDVRNYDVLDLRRRVQLVSQVPVTFPGTVAENLAVADAAAEVDGLLERVDLPRSLASRQADRLSVGEAQRMSLGRALACRPDALLLDEPTSALDMASKGAIERLVRGLADDGLTVVMISHDQDAAALGDHVVEVRGAIA
jgi:putative ABC transport system ATP-binding protein